MRGARILIVEDERLVARDLDGALTQLGYDVVASVASGDDAVRTAAALRPELVLMDIVLDGAMSGVDAAQQIRERFGIPVVYLTAFADEATLERAKVTEPFGYLVKPFEERELHTNIEMALYKAEMERKLRESEQWLSTTLRSIGDAVIATDGEGRVRFMNEVAVRLTGWPEAEALGLPLQRVFDIVNEETGRPAQNPAERVLRDGIVVGLANHTVLRSRDGREVPIADSAAPIRRDGAEVTGAVLVFRDVTERRRARQALAAEKERLAVTLRSIGDGVIVADVDGIVVSANAVAEQLTGWREADAAGRPLAEVFRRLDERTRRPLADPVAAALGAMSAPGSAERAVLVARDGAERSIAGCAAAIEDDGGQRHGVVLAFRDISDKLRVDEELKKVQKLESVGILAGGIAHDFNNYLTAILGNIGMARLGSHAEAVEALAEAEKACWRARDLTRQLLTFSRGGRPVKKPASIGALVRDSAGFALRGSSVACALAGDEGLWPVEVDAGQLVQVFNNLLINADQAQPDGGTVDVWMENLALGNGDVPGLEPGRYVKVAVRDQGVGISRAHLVKIFDPYFTTKQMGSGLGLAVSHSIVRAHGGGITADSELGEGSTFTVYLPAADRRPDEVEGDREALVPGRGRILVMDDEAILRRLASKLLTRLGYHVSLAADGADAVAQFMRARETGEPFDAVLLDLTVSGGMGGKETLDTLRRVDPAVRAVVISGYADDAVVADHEAHGFCGAVVKPFELAELSRAVRAAVEGG